MTYGCIQIIIWGMTLNHYPHREYNMQVPKMENELKYGQVDKSLLRFYKSEYQNCEKVVKHEYELLEHTRKGVGKVVNSKQYFTNFYYIEIWLWIELPKRKRQNRATHEVCKLTNCKNG